MLVQVLFMAINRYLGKLGTICKTEPGEGFCGGASESGQMACLRYFSRSMARMVRGRESK